MNSKSTTFKKQVLEQCKKALRGKIELISSNIEEINESMRSETKSSVGDKHETARARMQAENEKLSYMLAELLEQRKVLERIDLQRSSDQVSSDNIVFTNQRIFFLATALGKLEVDGKEIYVISKDSPIAKQLIGRKAGESTEFNKVSYRVEKIL